MVPLNIKCSRKCAMPDLPDGIVRRAIAIPYHMRHDRRAVIVITTISRPLSSLR